MVIKSRLAIAALMSASECQNMHFSRLGLKGLGVNIGNEIIPRYNTAVAGIDCR